MSPAINPSTAAKALTIAGALVGIGGYLSQPENLAVLSTGTAHYVAAAGAVCYVVGKAVTDYLTHQQVKQNAVDIAAVSSSSPGTPTITTK